MPGLNGMLQPGRVHPSAKGGHSRMKISSRKGYPVGNVGASNPAVPGQSAEAPASAQAVDGDQFEISKPGREIGELKKTLSAMPNVRMEKVEGLRESVEDGSYYVESEKIAKRVVDEALTEALRRAR